MRAIVVEKPTPHSELRVGDAPEPRVGPRDVKLEVHAAACNFFDTLIVQERYQVKPGFPFVPGGEAAGVVVEVGPEVTRFSPGDRVLALGSTGGYGERAVFPEAAVQPIPDAMPFDDASAIPITYPTSYAALVYRAALQPGETLLVHAAAGGVGLAAVQIGRALGARVIATAGGADKCAVTLEEGAEAAIDYRAEDFVQRIQELTDGRGADVIYDSVGGETTQKSLKCIAWNGRLLIVGFAGGDIPEIRANRILLKNIAVTGVHWGAYVEHEPERVPECFQELFALYERGALRPRIFGTYPLAELPDALQLLASRKTHGKLIIHPQEGG